jgi:hypothetical protein
MDEHVHKDFGKQFRDEINNLKQHPSKHIWENIDKALDKEEAKNYKEKYLLLRKGVLLLFFIGIAGLVIFYFNTAKNKPGGNKFTAQNTSKKNGSPQNKNFVADKESGDSPDFLSEPQIPANIFSITNPPQSFSENLFPFSKNFMKNRAKTKVKIKSGDIAYGEDIKTVSTQTGKINTEETDLPTTPALQKLPSVINENVFPKSDNAEKKNSPVITPQKSLSEAAEKKQKNKKQEFTLLAFAGPDYTDYRLINDRHNNYDNKAGIETRERSDLSFSFGILLGYAVGKRISVQSGITYAASNISINPIEIYAEKNNAGLIKYRYNTSYGYGYLQPSFSSSPAVGDSLFADGANHTLHYITVPVIVKYKIGKKKLSFNPGVGVGLNILTKATLTTDLVDNLNRETESISKLEGIKKLSASLIFTPELQYQLSKKLNLSLSPSFKYSLGPINKGNVVKTYPYTIGVGLGIIYKF